MNSRAPFAPTVLLGSFLLFQIQLLMAKQLLPWFGGVAGVWTLCFLFFQVVLVAGYSWADWLSHQTRARQRVLQTALIAASFASLPGVGVIAWQLQGTEDPAPRILGLLVSSLGLPCLVLVSGGLVLQGWSRRTFALSSVGGLLGIVVYPGLVEPWLSHSRQLALWTGAWVAFALLVAVRVWLQREVPGGTVAIVAPNRVVSAALATIPAAVLLVVTTQVSDAFVAAPLVWGIPFALYLMSFAIAYGVSRWYRRLIWLPLAVAAILVLALVAHPVAIVLAAFVVFLFCHGELVKRAASPVTIAAGGALGAALFVALPAVVFSVVVARESWQIIRSARVQTHNFFGSLVVSDAPGIRTLRQGATERGAQFLAEESQKLATGHYTHGSGVGLALDALMPNGPLTVGVFGLGAGTIFSYARPRDRYLVYELNPVLLNVASSQFTFMGESEVARDIRLGDPRVSLQRQPPRNFDFLVVDAPAGAFVPVHLLTREAFALYWKHLKSDGVLAVNVSSRYLALAPIVDLAAREAGKQAMLVHREEHPGSAEFLSDWVLVTSKPGFFETPGLQGHGKAIPVVPGLLPWTDDYSNIWRSLR